ncbi:MAG: protease modulator HflC [Elusimicrobiota bacterium]
MNSNRFLTGLFLFFIGVVAFSSSAYRLNEWQQSIIIRLGKPTRTIKDAGLHFRVPFIENIEILDKRILNWDGNPNQIPTKDKKYIDVDTTARWRIVDPLAFIQSVRDEDGATARLTAVLDAATRDVISNHNLVEAVRNSDAIIDKVKERAEMAKRGELPADEEEEITGELAKITVGRERLSSMIKESGVKEIASLKLGIELIDVQLRRISYEESVQRKVYERMIAERQRIAQRIRSVGQGEKAKIEGRIKKDLQGIESRAYSTAQQIMGVADAKAIRIYAQSMNADPDFYEFVRTLEAYRTGIPAETKLILSTDSRFLRYFRKN